MATNYKDFRIKNGLVTGAGTANEISYPTTDGTAGQVIVTDGSGNLSFSTISQGGIALTDLSVAAAGASGSGSLSYSNTTGVFTFTPPDLSSYLTSETTTSLSLTGNTLTFTDETGTDTDIDLSSFLDEDARAIASGSLNAGTGIVTFTRDDATTFTLDLSALLDDTNLVTSVNGSAGVVVLTADDIADGSTNAIPTLTQESNWDTAYGWGDHSTEGYLTAVAQSDVTQHQAALSITESQISDLSHYTNADVDAHLNQDSPVDGYVLSWTSGDYAWVPQSGGSSGIALTDLSASNATASGSGALSYNNTTGVFTFTPPDLSSYATETYVDNAVANASSGIPEDVTTTTTTSQVVIDTFDKDTYRGGEYVVQVESQANFTLLKLLILHNNNTTYLTTYGEIGDTLGGTIAHQINGTDVELLFTPTVADTTVTFKRIMLSNSGLYNTVVPEGDLATGSGTYDLATASGEQDLAD